MPEESVDVEHEESQEWDKERQYRDELSAANRREGELSAKLETAQRQLEDTAQSVGSESDDVDWSDYDQLTGAVQKHHQTVSQLTKDLSEQREANKALQSDISRINNEGQVAKGKKMLNDEVASLEKEFGTQNVTNSVLASVEKEYVENDVDQMPPKAKAAWIRNTLRIGFIEESGKLKSSGGGKEHAGVDVDTGSGNSAPSDEIPDGDFKTVSKAMSERDRRLGV